MTSNSLLRWHHCTCSVHVLNDRSYVYPVHVDKARLVTPSWGGIIVHALFTCWSRFLVMWLSLPLRAMIGMIILVLARVLKTTRLLHPNHHFITLRWFAMLWTIKCAYDLLQPRTTLLPSLALCRKTHISYIGEPLLEQYNNLVQIYTSLDLLLSLFVKRLDKND